ncbi:MAG: Gfo/Idh/MocA family oxidoreductase [Candidatus Brocadiia bacterium]
MPERLNAILVGCGAISGAWLGSDSLREETRITALVDIDPRAAESTAEKHALADVLIETDLEAALRAIRPDVVFNCTVPEAHCPVALTALEHGCHVLTEKPLSDNMGEARRMVEAARRADKTLAVIQNRRYLPQVRAVRDFLASGAIGRVTTVQSNFFLGPHFGGFREEMQHVLLVDMAIHTFDAARCITGADATSVYCHEWNPAGSWYEHGASAVAVFEMTDDVVYTYQGSWCVEGLNTSWEGEWRIIGEEGAVTWDGHGTLSAEAVAERVGFMSETREVEIPVPHMEETGHDGVIGEFIECFRNGGTPETAAADNIKSLAMVFGAVGSAERGQKVPVKA